MCEKSWKLLTTRLDLRDTVQQRLFLAPRVLCQTALPNPAAVFGMAGREIATRRGQLTVTPSKLVFLRASRKSCSHNTSLYRKSDIVWLRWKCRILRATCFTARATVQIPSYVYPWNLEYSLPRLESYSSWYCSGVCMREKTRFEICISRRNRRDLWRESLKEGRVRILYMYGISDRSGRD